MAGQLTGRNRNYSLWTACLVLHALAFSTLAAPAVDFSRYNAVGPIKVEAMPNSLLRATWNSGAGTSRLTLGLNPGDKLIASLEVAAKDSPQFVAVLRDADIEIPITVGSRTPPDRKQLFPYMYFDKPADRPHITFLSKLEKTTVSVETTGGRVAIHMGGFSAGPFTGEVVFRLYDGCPFVQIEAAASPVGKNIAYLYDPLIRGGVERIAYEDLDGKLQSRDLAGDALAPVKVRYRTLIGQNAQGSVAIFPTPHAFFYPRDFSDNDGFTQFDHARFGLRQSLTAGSASAPWFDAIEGKTQRMDFFLLPSVLPAADLLKQIKKYTHDDTFVPVDGHLTFVSHIHAQLIVNEMRGKRIAGNTPTGEFKAVFKKMGANIIHLAEFHRQNEDGHFRDNSPIRLNEMKLMFELCQKYSDDKFLLLPGEEGRWYMANPWPADPTVDPGHWMSFFPKPVYFTWVRSEGQPFAEEIPPYGTVYHMGSREDATRLLSEQGGLGWTSHPRIKASAATPDVFKDLDFYKSKIWLGAAWKAMPADLSEPRLGRRCLDLLDDMSNWAVAGHYPLKAMPGEIDLFEINQTHELYAHMNVNYLRLDKLPHPDNWTTVLDVLRNREFFTTTGEILIDSFSVKDGHVDGEIDWTFPLAHIELITGDGQSIKHQRIEMQSHQYGHEKFSFPLADRNAKWARMEVTDIARDTAYTQAVDLR